MRALSGPAGDVADGIAAPREMTLGLLLRAVTRYRFVVLLWMILVCGAAAAVIFSLQPWYRATGLVALDTRQIRFTEVTAAVSNAGAPIDSSAVRTEVDILMSDSLARAVVLDLNLVSSPEFAPATSWTADLAKRLPALPFTLPFEWPFDRTEVQPSPAQRLEQVVEAYRGRFSAFNDGRSYVIVLGFEARDPELAARITNRHAELYIGRQRATKDQALATATSWLDREVATLSDKLQASEQAVQDYRERYRLFSIEGASNNGTSLAQQQLAESSAELSRAQAEQASREARLQQARNPATANSVTEVVNSDALGRMRDQLISAQQKLAELAPQAGSAHPIAGPLREQIAQTQRMMASERALILRSLDNEANIARSRVAELRASVARLGAGLASAERDGGGLRRLEREASSNRALYESLLARQKQVATQVGIQQADVLLASPAVAPLLPSFPNKKLFLAVAILLAAATGAVIALLLDRGRRGFVTPEETESEIGMPVLAALPRCGTGNRALAADVAMRPRSLAAEAVRTLRNMLTMREGGMAPVLSITSALPGEGKTSVALSLGRSLAGSGFRVLLIEADLRRGQLMREVLRPTRYEGVVAVLEGRMSLAHAAQQDKMSSLQILAAETVPNNPQDLLEPVRLQPVIKSARASFDYIIIDTPPVTAVSDSLLIGRSVDETLIVVRAESTPPQAVNTTVRAFRAARLPVAGFVLNATSSDQNPAQAYTMNAAVVALRS